MSARTVAERMRARRETWFKVGGVEYLIRRPRHLDLGLAFREGGQTEVALRAVVGWRGMKLCDLIPGEPDIEAPFDEDTFREWVGDHVDVLTEIAAEVARLIDLEFSAAENAAKN